MCRWYPPWPHLLAKPRRRVSQVRGGRGESGGGGVQSWDTCLPDEEGGPESMSVPKETLASWSPALLPEWREWLVVQCGEHLRTRLWHQER